MIEIRELNRESLLAYINSEEFGQGDYIPITTHRAISQAANPRLQEEDIILLLAFEKDVLAGYLGILPDLIFIHGKDPIRMGWLSCLWVSPHSRGKGLGVEMIQRALKLWNNNILSADYVPATKKLYDKTNQFVHEPLSRKGIRLYIRSDLYTILPPKKEVFARTKALLRAFDFTANVILNTRLLFSRTDVFGLGIEYTDHIDEEVDRFIAARQAKQLFKRNGKDLNWIINNPWILVSSEKSALDKKYHFSSTARSFYFHSLKIRNASGKLIGFMILSKINNSLKLPYLYHDDCIESIIRVIHHYLIQWKITTFTTFHPELVKGLKKLKGPSLFQKEILRNYMISSVFDEPLRYRDFHIQDGDGDSSFT